jgi:hypothetical protein
MPRETPQCEFPHGTKVVTKQGRRGVVKRVFTSDRVWVYFSDRNVLLYHTNQLSKVY